MWKFEQNNKRMIFQVIVMNELNKHYLINYQK